MSQYFFSSKFTIKVKHKHFISSVVKRCIPNNILQLVDIASQNNVSLNDMLNSTDVTINILLNAVKNIKLFSEFEGVSYVR